MRDIAEIMNLAPVIPVIVIDDVAHARPLAEALVAGGLRALEVTLAHSGRARRDAGYGGGEGRNRRRGYRDQQAGAGPGAGCRGQVYRLSQASPNR